MAETFQEWTLEEFNSRYQLIVNPLNPLAGWALNDSDGCLYETYGEELEFVKRQPARQIWTLVDGDDGALYLLSGFHLVNRIGYLVSTTPVPDDVAIQVRVSIADL
jgi:hypothetical protein